MLASLRLLATLINFISFDQGQGNCFSDIINNLQLIPIFHQLKYELIAVRQVGWERGSKFSYTQLTVTFQFSGKVYSILRYILEKHETESFHYPSNVDSGAITITRLVFDDYHYNYSNRKLVITYSSNWNKLQLLQLQFRLALE